MYHIGTSSLLAWLISLVGIPLSLFGLILGRFVIEKTWEDLLVRNGMNFLRIGFAPAVLTGFLGVVLTMRGIL